MGRPIPRKFFGPLDPTISANNKTWSSDGFDPQGRDVSAPVKAWNGGFNIPVERAKIASGELDIGGSASQTPYILSQRGSRKFKVRTSSGDGDCFLVNPANFDDSTANPAGADAAFPQRSMVVSGFLNDAGSPIALRRFNRHRAYDWNGNVYKWYVLGDGSSLANRIILETI